MPRLINKKTNMTSTFHNNRIVTPNTHLLNQSKITRLSLRQRDGCKIRKDTKTALKTRTQQIKHKKTIKNKSTTIDSPHNAIESVGARG